MTGFKLSEEELNLYSADKNAAEFIEVVKDKICDWILYHNVYVPSRDKIQVLSVTFEEDEPSVALALLIDKDSKFDGYKFAIYLNDYRGRGVHVDVFNLRNSKVTNNWDGMTYLGFDKKGYSYELTKEEYYYLEYAHQRMSLEDIKAFGVTFDEASKVFEGFRKGGH